METPAETTQTPATQTLTSPAILSHSFPANLVEELADTANAEAVFKRHGLSIAEGVRILRKSAARKQVALRKELGQTHTRILAHKYSPSVASKFLNLVENGPELISLKAGMEILSLSGLKKPAAALTAKPQPPVQRPPTDDDRRIQAAYTKLLLLEDQLEKDRLNKPADTSLPSNQNPPAS